MMKMRNDLNYCKMMIEANKDLFLLHLDCKHDSVLRVDKMDKVKMNFEMYLNKMMGDKMEHNFHRHESVASFDSLMRN